MKRKRKLLLRALGAALVLLAAALLLRCGGNGRDARKTRVRTNEDRVAWLASLGWQVEAVPVSEQKISLPDTFPSILAEYNELQKEQGFDLEKYAGKDVVLYTYRVLNYPSEEEVCCCVYVWRSHVVGGDIHAAAVSGFMTGLFRNGER